MLTIWFQENNEVTQRSRMETSEGDKKQNKNYLDPTFSSLRAAKFPVHLLEHNIWLPKIITIPR